MKRGRIPTPSSERRAAGKRVRKDQDFEPVQAVEGVPTCPEWLSPEAKGEWPRVIADLQHLGVLSKTDRASIIGFCVAFGEFEHATKTLGTEGHFYTDDKGTLRAHPAVSVQQNAMSKMRSYASEFGLSPASRGRVPKKKDDKPNDDDELGIRKRN